MTLYVAGNILDLLLVIHITYLHDRILFIMILPGPLTDDLLEHNAI